MLSQNISQILKIIGGNIVKLLFNFELFKGT